MNKGYCTFTNHNGGHWFILQSEKKKLTVRMMTEILRQIAIASGKTEDDVAEVMLNRQAVAEFRKRIEPLRFEKRDENFHMEVGKPERPHHIGNHEPDRVTVFTEPPKENARLKRFLEE